MKRIFTLFLLVSISLFTKAQTSVSGSQSGTWTAAGAPYEVNGTITVPVGQTLTIEAGVEVNFQGYYQFILDGKVIANGTEEAPILFTTDNHATGWGGVRMDGTNEISIFHYCTFEYGKTSTGSYPDIHGGAFLLKDANAEFYNCTFAHNDATGDDNGIGGAIYAFNTGSASVTLTKFIDCLFLENHSYGEGGAIRFSNDGHTELTRCQFINNSTGYGGGALHVYTALDTSFTNCLFYGNISTTGGGGAIKAMNPSVSMSFTNCTFAYNHATGSGEGGALDLSYSDITMVNSIVYENTQTYGDEINIGTASSADINFSDLDMPSDATGSNNIYASPVFVDSASGDFHLQNVSPCIDSGTDVGLPYAGTAPDMGCYEYGYGISVADYQSVDFSLFPNPSTGIFQINSEQTIVDIKVFDLLGKIIFNQSNETQIKSIDLSSIPKGSYFVEITTQDNKRAVKKIIIK